MNQEYDNEAYQQAIDGGLVGAVSSVSATTCFAHDYHSRHHHRDDGETRGLTKRFDRHRHDRDDRHDRHYKRHDRHHGRYDLYRRDHRYYWRYPRKPYYRYYWHHNGDDDLFWFGLGFALPYLLDDRFDD